MEPLSDADTGSYRAIREPVNNSLAAVDDFYIRRGLGPASAARVQITAAAPRALDQRARLRYLREVQRCPSPRN